MSAAPPPADKPREYESDAAREGMTVLESMADPSFIDELDEYRQRHPDSTWVYDPEVEGVVGLVQEGTRDAVVVVYVDREDFEVDEERFES